MSTAEPAPTSQVTWRSHRRIGWRRHGQGVAAAAATASMTETATSGAAALAMMGAQGQLAAEVQWIGAGIGLLMMLTLGFVALLLGYAVLLTVVRAVLHGVGRNVGIVYPMAGLVAGLTIIGLLAPPNLLTAGLLLNGATGALAGLVYWLVAARNEVRPIARLFA